MTRPLRLVVTTSRKPTSAQLERVDTLTRRLGGVARRRDRAVDVLVSDESADGAYLILRTHEEVRVAAGSTHIHPGMIYLKQKNGRGHPLLRAVAPHGGAPVRALVDCTLGAASDAIHLAHILPDLTITGAESSPVLYALLEEGLPRLAGESGRMWASAAARIDARHIDARQLLAAMPPDSVDVVFLDPMFRRAGKGSGGFSVVQALANHEPVDDAWLADAHRVARRRVVLKIDGAQPVPFTAPPSPGWNRRVRGGAVDYLVCERELPHPEWDTPTL